MIFLFLFAGVLIIGLKMTIILLILSAIFGR
jgi:hypothetical protein